MAAADLTAARLRELFHYDPLTGVFTWLVRGGSRCAAGSIAATFDKDGYAVAKVGRHRYRLHRLAWLYVHGILPEGVIDHINGIKSDNRIVNLRDVANIVNVQNQRAASSNSSSGLLGVFPTSRHRWGAKITAGGKVLRLGTFESAQRAHEAYLDAKRRLHSGCTI